MITIIVRKKDIHIEYHKWWSHNLCRDMEYKVFGHDGQAFLAFPCQDGRYYDWENYGMIATLAPFIDAGRIRIICVDGIDWGEQAYIARFRTAEERDAFLYDTCNRK